jgi:pre-mRNA-processing factor 17
MGHHQAVKDVSFSNDGRKFLSCGYDRQMKLWDTETGKSVPDLFTVPPQTPLGACLKAFSNGKIPYVVRFHPDEDMQHIFLAGMSDKKIIQVCVTSQLPFCL